MDVGTVKQTVEGHIESETELVTGTDGQLYARFWTSDGVQVVSVDAPRFEEWLIQHCLENWIPAKKLAIKSAIVAAKAKGRTKLDPVCVRIGNHKPSGKIYWDLCDGTGTAVEITPDGWNIVKEPKVLFPTHQLRQDLDAPQKGGSVHGLRQMFGLSAQNEALIISFCLACLRGVGPYPLLVISGPDSSGNTALACYLRALLDPSALALRNPPKTEKELATSAKDNYLLAYDDVQEIPQWLSQAFCRLSKGTTFSECRGGVEQVLFMGARPVMLVGSDDMLLDRDVASRALVVRLDPRTKFTTGVGSEVEGLAQMRGALLDIACHGLGRLGDVDVPAPLRDYDSEKWIAACELPRWGLEAYKEAYEATVVNGFDDLVELDPLLRSFRDYIQDVKAFRGTAGQLLKELNAMGLAKGNRWPQSPRALSGRLRRDAKLLPEIEMEFDMKEGRNRDRLMDAKAKPSPEPRKGNSGSTQDGLGRPASRPKGASAGKAMELPLFGEG